MKRRGTRGERGEGRPSRKDLQLCGEVRRTLDLSLAEVGDARLHGAWVADVLPAPDVARLLVVIELPADGDVDGARELLGALGGRMRVDVAEAIQRRRVPDLTFQVRVRLEGEP